MPVKPGGRQRQAEPLVRSPAVLCTNCSHPQSQVRLTRVGRATGWPTQSAAPGGVRSGVRDSIEPHGPISALRYAPRALHPLPGLHAEAKFAPRLRLPVAPASMVDGLPFSLQDAL